MTERASLDFRPAAMVVAVGISYAASLVLVGTLAQGQNAATNNANGPAVNLAYGADKALSVTEQALTDADAALTSLAAQAQAGSADATRLHALISNLDAQLAALRGTGASPSGPSLTSISLAIPTPRPAVQAVTGASGVKP